MENKPMNERIIVYSLNLGDPLDAGVTGGSETFIPMPIQATLIYAAVSPMDDDAGATIDIQDDTTDIVTAIDASDHDVPGEWISTACGGTQTPVSIAAGSMLEIDINSAAAANRFDIVLWFLTGSNWG